MAGVFVSLAISSGLGFYNLGLYLTVLNDEHGYGEGPLSAATAVVFALSGALGIPIGAYISRRDPRGLLLVGAVAGSGALALLGRVDALWQVYAVYALLAIGFAFTGLVPCYSIVTRWFHRRRAVAMSVASTGLSVGGIVFTPVSEALIDRGGLDGAAPWLAAAWLVGVVVVTLTLIRPDPASVGQHPDGVAPELDDDGVEVPAGGWSLADAVATRYFVVLAVAYVLIMGSQVGGMVHTFNLVDGRIDSSTAALVMSVIAASSITARLAGGAIAHRIDLRRFTVAMCVVQGVGLALLSVLDSRVGLLVAAVVFGLSVGNLLMLQPLLLSATFGVLDYPRIYARANAVTTLGLVVGPTAVGLVKDSLDSYTVPFLMIAASAGVAAVLLGLVAREPEAAPGAQLMVTPPAGG